MSGETTREVRPRERRDHWEVTGFRVPITHFSISKLRDTSFARFTGVNVKIIWLINNIENDRIL